MNPKFEHKLISSFLSDCEKTESKPDSYGPDEKQAEAPPQVVEVNIGQSTSQSIQPEAAPSNFSLYKLQNTAKEISEFTASNINTLYREQGNTSNVDEAVFLDFFFCGSKLAGNFKTFYKITDENNNKMQIEGRSYVYWDGNKLTIA